MLFNALIIPQPGQSIPNKYLCKQKQKEIFAVIKLGKKKINISIINKNILFNLTIIFIYH